MSHIFRHNVELTVVADPNIVRIAINSLCTNPIQIAIGKNNAGKTINLIALHTTAILILFAAFFISNPPPNAIKPSGVAKTAIFFTVRSIMAGCGIRSTDQISPITIPIIIGLVRIPLQVFFISTASIFFSLHQKHSRQSQPSYCTEHTSDNHQRRHPCIPINILHKCNP